MNIINFTPVSAFTGGVIIGLAVVVFFLLNGRLVGISGIASNALTEKNNRFDNFLFLVGLIMGPILYTLFTSKQISVTISNSYILLIIAGLLVGVVYSMTSLFFPDLAELSIFVLMAVVLLIRPQGLFGKAGAMG